LIHQKTTLRNLYHFDEEFAFPLDDNLRGHTTIEVLKLNDRPDLVERRRERMRTLRLMRDVVNLMPQSPLASDARQILNEARLDSGEYAAMSRVFLQTHPTGGPASE
jgi:hypothetical protein